MGRLANTLDIQTQSAQPQTRSRTVWIAHRKRPRRFSALTDDDVTDVPARHGALSSWRRQLPFVVERTNPPGDAEVRKWWRKWMVRLQRHRCKEDLIFDGLDDMNDLGRFLLHEGIGGDCDSCEHEVKRVAVATLLGQHFKERWQTTSVHMQQEKLGTAAWQAGLDRPVGNLAMPGATLDAQRLRAIGVRYINAASVPSSSGPSSLLLPHYIATQHPMPSTVDDFWRMVLVERPTCIVMLNGFDYTTVGEQNPAEACAPYWSPDAVSADSGLILTEVEVQSVLNHGVKDVLRTLRVSLCGVAQDRAIFPHGMSHEVRQLCVYWWRDQACPSIDQFVSSWSLFHELLKTSAEPAFAAPKVIVHCAGGIGRVGVWIAADLCARAVAYRSSTLQGLVDYPDFQGFPLSPDLVIGYLRSRRVNMVQTEDQYFFLHYAIAHLVKQLVDSGQKQE